MKMAGLACSVLTIALMTFGGLAHAQTAKPNILFIASDNTDTTILGPYGGGEGRGMPTPNIDRLASDGIDLLFLLQLSQVARPVEPPCRPDASLTAAA